MAEVANQCWNPV